MWVFHIEGSRCAFVWFLLIDCCPNALTCQWRDWKEDVRYYMVLDISLKGQYRKVQKERKSSEPYMWGDQRQPRQGLKVHSFCYIFWWIDHLSSFWKLWLYTWLFLHCVHWNAMCRAILIVTQSLWPTVTSLWCLRLLIEPLEYYFFDQHCLNFILFTTKYGCHSRALGWFPVLTSTKSVLTHFFCHRLSVLV